MVGRGKKKNIRRAGSKEPPGQTKVNIILFLASGRKSRQDILDYSKKMLGISTARGIDKHLVDLTSAGIIVKEPTERGFELYYHLNHEFSGLREIVHYCDLNGKINDLISSKYGEATISEKLLSDLTKEILIVIETNGNLLAAIPRGERSIELDFLACKLLTNYPEGMSEEEQFRIHMNEYDRTFPEFVRDALKPFAGTPEYEVKKMELCRLVAEKQFEIQFEKNELLPSVFQSINDTIFHPEERNEIVNILKSSPRAVKFIFLLINNNRIFRNYSLNLIFFIEKENEARSNKENHVLVKKINEEIKEYTVKVVAATKRPTLLLQALRGMLLLDIFEEKAIPTSWTAEFIRQPFIPFGIVADSERGLTVKFDPSEDPI